MTEAAGFPRRIVAFAPSLLRDGLARPARRPFKRWGMLLKARAAGAASPEDEGGAVCRVGPTSPAAPSEVGRAHKTQPTRAAPKRLDPVGSAMRAHPER